MTITVTVSNDGNARERHRLPHCSAIPSVSLRFFTCNTLHWYHIPSRSGTRRHAGPAAITVAPVASVACSLRCRAQHSVIAEMQRTIHWASLPFDLWTQKVLPCLTWRDTSVVSCVCSEWHNVTTAAEPMSSEWRTTVLGPAATANESLDLVRANALQWVDTRFVPTLILLVAASHDTTPWRRGKFWQDVVAIMEQAKLLPFRCHVIGILTKNAVVQNVEKSTVKKMDIDSAVTLSISVAHLSDTTLEMATFDRKMLRRASRTQSLVNPFQVITPDYDNDKPSFLLFGGNDQSASELIAAVDTWYPGAPVVGAVSSTLVDQCIPLATYSVSRAQGIGAVRGRQDHKTSRRAQQKTLRCQPHRPLDPVVFPSSLLLRLHGHVGIRSFSSSGYYPITPVIRCVRSSLADELSRVVTHDTVSLLPSDGLEENTQLRVVDVVAPSEILAIEQEGRRLNIFSCQDRAPLEHVLTRCNASESKVTADSVSAQIDRLEVVFWWQGSLMSLSDIGWQEGAYGLLASHQPKRTSGALAEALARIQARLALADERAFGAFIVAGALNEVDDFVHGKNVGDLCAGMLPMCQLSGCVVSTSVGPVAFPGGDQLRNIAQVQTHTTCGAVFYTKKRMSN
uniref:FIST domain-containing protein n=1 Tax=Hyaloperonospora arabidopsidis (strain Emoy2) TaxID=559515 RepID=M4B7E8_HYAAE